MAPAIDALTIPSWDVGVIVLDGDKRETVVQLIDGDAPLPQTVQRVFTFAYDHMTAMRVELTAGPGSRRDEVVVLGALELVGLPLRARGDQVVLSVTRTAAEIHAVLTDEGSGRAASLRVQTSQA